MKRNEILEKYSLELKKMRSTLFSTLSSDIIFFPHFSKEEVEIIGEIFLNLNLFLSMKNINLKTQ